MKIRRISVFVVFLALVTIASVCSRKTEKTAVGADGVLLFYGVGNCAIYNSDKDIVGKLLSEYGSLEFVETEEEMDVTSMLSISFYKENEAVVSFNVDENGVFILRGETAYRKISSGRFDYDYAYEIYENSKNR